MRHIIIQTGQVPFFNQIAESSIQVLDLVVEHMTPADELIFIAINKDIYYAYERFKAQNEHHANANIKLIDLSDSYDMSITGLCIYLFEQLIHEQVNSVIDTLTIFNGACVEDSNQEVSYFAHWLSATTAEPLSSFALNQYEAGMMICFQLIDLIACKQSKTLQINNINEDPMQCKLTPLLHYIATKFGQRTKLYKHVPEVKQFFFHEHDGYEFCPFQQYAYLHGKRFTYVNASHTELDAKQAYKKHDFAFSMTNVWSDKNDRTEIIDALQYMHTKSFNYDTKFIFQYACKHIARQDLINNSDELLSYQDYLNLLRCSKYTLIIPSYDTTTFSLRRFVEALTQMCVPLVYDKCNMDWMPTELYDILECSSLIVHDLSKLKEHVNSIKLNWHNQLNALTHCNWVRTYTTDGIYLDCLKKCKLL